MTSSNTHAFSELGICSRICDAIDKLGFETPTAVQAQALPAILKGQDVKIQAPTGTGKTAAYALPILQKLHESYDEFNGHPRGLIVVPTRELADQVVEQIKLFRTYLKPKAVLLQGGVSMDMQEKLLEKEPDLLVATPGRLLDLEERDFFRLDKIEYLVLDEADRMLDFGFSREIARIQELIPAVKQVSLLSATFTETVKELIDSILTDPIEISLSTDELIPKSIVHLKLDIEADRKREILAFLLEFLGEKPVLVFVQKKSDADALAAHLNAKHIKCYSLHGDKRQEQRKDILRGFKDGNIPILIATDVAARGLDVENLPLVINFDLPFQPEDYVHRIGRTGRKGEKGMALSLVARSQRGLLTTVEEFIGFSIDDLSEKEPSLAMMLPMADLENKKKVSKKDGMKKPGAKKKKKKKDEKSAWPYKKGQ